MRKQTQKSVMGVAGVISAVLGFMFVFPAFLREQFAFSAVASFFVIVGLILLALAFGDW